MNTPLAPDAELIALCERVVAINAEERAIAAKYPDIDKDADDDPTDGPILDALSAEWHEIKRRILDLTITTLAGADAAGRAAFPESRQEQEAPGIEAVPTDLYELLALKLVEFHAGRPIGPAVQSADDRHPLLAIEEPLRALTTAVSLLGHLSVSELDVEGNDLEAVQTIIERAHRDIERRWEAGRNGIGVLPEGRRCPRDYRWSGVRSGPPKSAHTSRPSSCHRQRWGLSSPHLESWPPCSDVAGFRRLGTCESRWPALALNYTTSAAEAADWSWWRSASRRRAPRRSSSRHEAPRPDRMAAIPAVHA